jgi:ribonucleoside-diphosphate reductase alpha chain
MDIIKVTKRDGTKEDFDIAKVKQSIAHACAGTEVNPLKLESRIDYFLKQGIRTSDIQLNIVGHAKQLANAQEPEWLMVAGHAFAMHQQHSSQFLDKPFAEFINYVVGKGFYDKSLLSYSSEELNEFGNYIKHDRDLDCSYAALITNSTKYQNKYETNQQMHMVNALRFGLNVSPEQRTEFVKEVYNVLSKREFSLATPFMSNLRSGGNTASCFIISIEDDIDSIFNNIHRIAKISKNGGGLGIYLGNLRAKGSSVGKAENASNTIVQWVKIINDTLVAVNQGGKRAGAGTVALPIWHNDILDFLDMQTEHGDVRLKAYDVFPQVTTPDIFMHRDEMNLEWTTFCPFEVKQKLGIDIRGKYGKDFEEAYSKIEQAYDQKKLKVSRRIKAKDLTKQIMRVQFETGLPYLAFVDQINEFNPNKNDPESIGIPCVNLCTESFSNVVPDKYGHVCNLGSINMGNIRDMEHLAAVSKIACKILNTGIEMTNHPDSITKAHNERYRTIGIGVMGLHDYFARERYSYANTKLISEIFECIEYNAALQSVELAKEKGAFGAFKYSAWKDGSMTKRFKEIGCGKYEWGYLQSQIDIHGMRNSQLTSPAPTTSTSISQDASASVLPIYSAFFSEDNKTGSVKVAAKYLKDNPIGYGKTQVKFSAKEIIDACAAMQKFTDTGISMELIFDQNKPDFKAKDLYDAIHYAHKQGLKAIYYIRSVKQKEQAGEDCVACAG